MSVSPPPPKGVERIREDKWNANPPQVTSYLTYPRFEPSGDHNSAIYASPICGFGWRFQFIDTFHYQRSSSMPRVQELVGQLEVTFQPQRCSSMPFSNVKVRVKVSYPMDEAKSVHEREFVDVSVIKDSELGIYTEPLRYKGQTQVEITLTFNPSDGLSLPTTPSINTRIALRHSLDGPTFVDTKFYLFSTKVQGRPALPKIVFAKSMLLTNSSSYLHDLLTPGTGFTNGTPCDLRQNVPEEVAKLDPDAFEYDSDSDLEDDEEMLDTKGKGKAPEAPSLHDIRNSVEDPGPLSTGLCDGRAFAINGTAYTTWKSFMFYTYTNDIRFNSLKSQRSTTDPLKSRTPPADSDIVSCSPKSMYRFADYVRIDFSRFLLSDVFIHSGRSISFEVARERRNQEEPF
ncbi:hypothetical protein P691DRAFT_536473 [Macrolepiota fuliginosa MF-IS2]|uniref:Uncharacterized protein n=1 Tax=Macrolepiota fuliginosa MF-IS2 TaxID=1400762 RepID=A0A9P5X0N9_9AGAR|nr:hypothetical protein P691DRAFT_536473 [Macrolepiota fuliginosa MF-IS2]